MAKIAPSDPALVAGMTATRGELQVIRAEAQNWLKSIQDLNTMKDIVDVEARGLELDRTLQESVQVAHKDLPHVGSLLGSLDQRLRSEPSVVQKVGDEITNIVNAWDRAELEFGNLEKKNPSGDAILPPLVPIKKHLDEVVRRCGYLTIPARVGEHLEGLRMGQGLDFNATFQDELPEATDREEVLKYLRDHPATVDGVIDVETGRIFKASPNAARRLLSLGLIAIGIGVDFLVFWLVARFTSIAIPDNPVDAARWPVLWHALTAALAGGLAHILVAAVKQSRARASEEAFLAIDDLLLWAHVREVQLFLSALSFIIAIFGLLFVLKTTDVKTAIFVGFSLDSFVDIFLQRFEKGATAQVATLKKSAEGAA